MPTCLCLTSASFLKSSRKVTEFIHSILARFSAQPPVTSPTSQSGLSLPARMSSAAVRCLAGAISAALFLAGFQAVGAPAPPANFAVEDVLTNIEQPTAMRFLPDGRMLLVLKKGVIRIVNVQQPVQSDVYMNLAAPEHVDGLEADQERGVLDIAIDPSFPASPYVYIFYTPLWGPNGPRARVARFTHVENSGGVTSRGNPTSELILWQDTEPYDSCCHFGGGLDFGPDGNLWLTTGEHFQGSYASNLQKAGGKVHRFTKTGAIPAGNPYADGAGSNVDSTFAYGLRNPFRARWDLPTGRFFIAEVGGNTQSIAWEDLHVIRYHQPSGRFVDSDFGTGSDNGVYNGINFGWPTVEGLPPHTDFPGAVISANVGEPIFAWRHNGNFSAINGGLVYRGSQFPVWYSGAYFYADSTRDFIRYLKFNPDGSIAANPAPAAISYKNPDLISYPFDLTPLGRVIAIEVGPDGALYYASFTDAGGAYGEPNPYILGAVRRYVYDDGNVRPEITQFSASPPTGPGPLVVNFSIRAVDPEGDPMTYTVNFGDGTPVTASAALPGDTTITISHTYLADGPYQATLSVSDAAKTQTETVAFSVGTAPVISSLTSSNPRPGSTSNMFRFNDTITFSATATDAEDGVLSGSQFSWSVSFVRPGSTHPAFGPVSGATSVNFPIPNQGQGFSGPVYYRCFLTVTDSSGISRTSTIDIFPEKSNISFSSVPSGINIQVDGNTANAAPYVLDSLINVNHLISVPLTVPLNGRVYVFSHWSDGPTTLQRAYNVPVSDSSLTAFFDDLGPAAEPPTSGLVMHVHGEAGLTVNGSDVVSWDDQTGNNNHLTAASAPSAVSFALNGQTAVHFDGAADALFRTGFTGLPTGSAARSVFMVARYTRVDATTQSWVGFAYGNAANNEAFGLALNPVGQLGVQGWGGGNDILSDPPIGAVNRWLTQSAIYSGGAVNQYSDGTLIGSTAHTFATGTDGIRLGEELNGGKNLEMDVAEVMVYDRAVTEMERQQIETYFQQRYAIDAIRGNRAPTVTITAPANNAALTTSQMPVTLTATATDAEDGNLGASLSWSSSLDGPLGVGPSITVTLSPGNHVLSARVFDSFGLPALASVNVTVTIVGNGVLVTSGLVTRLESDLNVMIESGTTVAGWLDRSGFGNDVAANGSPQWGVELTPTGKPSVTLDGASGKLERTGPLGGLPVGNAERTMFVVAKYNSST
ncbi:MAG: PQQ-dependent sugar dehydrogenase, partial [Chthoniobacteraceae bacterium]